MMTAIIIEIISKIELLGHGGDLTTLCFYIMTHLEEYNQIINFRKSNPLSEDQYGENHHVVPKSICPILKNSTDNIVRLSAQEHFLAHYHLWKAYKDELHEKKWTLKMGYAFRRMKQQLLKCDDVETMSKLYEEIRKTFSKVQRESMKGRKNPKAIAAMRKARLGSHQTDSAKEANRKAHLGKRTWLGRHHTEETKKKLSKAHKGKKGTLHTDGAKQKISNARYGRKWYTNGKIEICTKNGCPNGFVNGRLRTFVWHV